MPTRLTRTAFILVLAALPSGAYAAKGKTMAEILEASTAADWRTPDPDNLLVLDLPGGRAVIELAPYFAPEHVANIRTLAREGYWNGLSINRSQDNFVVQWGDPAEDPAQAKPLGSAKAKLPAEFARAGYDKTAFHPVQDRDGWSKRAGFVQGFPAATDRKRTWLAHCYGTLGAGRGNEPDSSNGTELYVVTGQSPRQLDLNITTVGRVLQGMEHLSVLPRGTGPLGFYEKPEQRTPIVRLALASALPDAERPRLEVLRTDTATFDALVEARRNRSDDWYLHKAGHIDLCNIPISVRSPK
ncbi:peptidyl-prolyl cis-trans isomerase [Arenimonas maotaiensis]|uniref:peptidylprolyl isomerase n=1 Tax=Arenimonas maotaiensis TaxID=1446479 RepID=A0A917CD31_9GAMM|nr:peptidylprolyl isomerase [Arenimonas maotaiensis]GGF84752.1 peptidyl-prolyl cis-trans isomerase [Arenimonas maotaiensis]